MSLVTSKELLLRAKQGGYAIGAFNTENMEMVLAVLSAAEELRSPVIIQTTASTTRYGGIAVYAGMVRGAADQASVPVALHLDHSSSFETVAQAVRVGYTSIMIDGSHCAFDENIAITKKVAELCKPNGIPVEAELGQVGGKEDDVTAEGDLYTDPQQAKEFTQATGIDSLAIAIGTAHGFYTGTPKLDLERLVKISTLISVPIVLHGASGVPDDAVRLAISKGICKVNYATELRVAYSEGVKRVLRENPTVYDPKEYGKEGMRRVKALVMEKIRVCGSAGML